MPIKVTLSKSKGQTAVDPQPVLKGRRIPYVPFFASEFARRFEERDGNWWSYTPHYGRIVLPRFIMPEGVTYRHLLVNETIRNTNPDILFYVSEHIYVSTNDPHRSTIMPYGSHQSYHHDAVCVVFRNRQDASLHGMTFRRP